MTEKRQLHRKVLCLFLKPADFGLRPPRLPFFSPAAKGALLTSYLGYNTQHDVGAVLAFQNFESDQDHMTNIQFFYLVMLALYWLGLPLAFCSKALSRHLLTAASASRYSPSQSAGSSPVAPKENVEYEGSFQLPSEGDDPFTVVSILRANASTLKAADTNAEALSRMAKLAKALVQEEANNIQHQNDLWLIGRTRRAVDMLHSNPLFFPSSDYSLREGNGGLLFVRTEVPFWMVDAESALLLVVQDVMKDVMGTELPNMDTSTPEDSGDKVLPVQFGYDTTRRRTVQFSFGDSVVTVTCGRTLESGGAIGISHGSYNVTIASDANVTGATVTETPVANDVIQPITVTQAPLIQAEMKQQDGLGTILAGYRDIKMGIITDPQGKRHGGSFYYKNVGLEVQRDFDDRINIVKPKYHNYSAELHTDLADDRDHAYKAKFIANTPEADEAVVFGGGFDANNHPTAALKLKSDDLGIEFNGEHEKRNYVVRIGPFVFDVTMRGGLPEFVLTNVIP